ncbi:GNAT family N-acetyltransferase [Nocardioides daejeonensis]|uniref:GNAT family N-acetyltransferase n=1 Tax=Nocardioides daejeonensis TaxID=1046556 RepID=UPI000D748562|nr:GNAT family N-acetyltransferase [Nocardioides daejeonensis]
MGCETEDVEIRRAGPRDAEPLADLHLDVWEEAYTGLIPERILLERRDRRRERIERWRQILTVDAHPSWVAVDTEPGLLGFATSGYKPDASSAELPSLRLMALYVRQRCYGTGLGSRLLATAVGDRAAHLWVLDGNLRAISFYRRHGFVFDGHSELDDHGRERRMVRARSQVR